ncbi:MAG TPA: hypothetical protein VN374_03955 [Desulfitobacteriaceae bacterium]|nr:hypothetical protein [Desulfitobacteriaceae bacterium]
MLINWFTVIAQIFNFLVLVWLLKRFLYKPILNAIDAREKLIADKLAAAESNVEAAQKEREEFVKKNETFEMQRTELLRQAEEEANRRRQQLLETARTEYQELQTKRNKMLLKNEKILDQNLKLHTNQEIFAIVRKTLADLSGVSLEDRIIDVFINKLQELSQEDQAQLLLAYKATSGSITVSTMFELSSAQQAMLETAIKEFLKLDGPILFDTASELIGGIELVVNNRKISWNISDYLTSLEESIKALLERESKTPLEDERLREKKPEKGDYSNDIP